MVWPAAQMDEIAKLEQRLTGDGGTGHLNDITLLYGHCESPDLHVVAEALKALGRVLVHHRRGTADAGSSAPHSLVAWLGQHTEAYHATLTKLATSADARAQVCAIRLIMAAVREEVFQSRSVKDAAEGPSVLEKRVKGLVSELLLAPAWSEHATQCLAGEFLKPYVDVRHWVLLHLKVGCKHVGEAEVADSVPEAESKKRRRQVSRTFAELFRGSGLVTDELFSRVFALLGEAPEPVSEERQRALNDVHSAGVGTDAAEDTVELLAPEGRPKGFFLRGYRRLVQEAWLQLLGLPVPVKKCVQVLQFLPVNVMPHLSEPLMLSDFYLRAFHSGSTELSVLALSGLLLLLTRYGMGDPEMLSSSASEFYVQLYSLIKPETFRLRKRARFQRLVVAALYSGLLPARYAAVFAKKCMRTAVGCADPGTTMWLMAVAYSLIQKHHSHCRYLLHREQPSDEPMPRKLLTDPFDPAAPLTVALEQVADTSLWELMLLQRHHLPAVVLLTKLFLKPFFTPSARKLDPELFLDQSVEKTYKQALRAGERQMAKWKARAEKCPLAFRTEDDGPAADVARWAALLSTSQRKIGTEG